LRKKQAKGELRIFTMSAYVEGGKPPALAISTNFVDWEWWAQVMAVLRVQWERQKIREEMASGRGEGKESA